MFRFNFLFVVALRTGCGPSVLIERPSDWSETWRGRALYATPGACIYASTQAAAGEIDRRLEISRTKFARDMKAEPTRGLVLVIDLGDPALTDDGDALFVMLERGQLPIEFDDNSSDAPEKPGDDTTGKEPEGTPDRINIDITNETLTTSQPAGDEERSGELNEARRDEMVAKLRVLLQATPFRVRSDDATGTLELPSPPDAGLDWIAVLPTDRQCRDTARQMIDMALDQPEIGLVQKLAIMPFRPVMESAMSDAFKTERDGLIDDLLIWSHADWTEQERIDHIKAGRKDRMGHVKSSLRVKMKQPKPAVNAPADPSKGGTLSAE